MPEENPTPEAQSLRLGLSLWFREIDHDSADLTGTDWSKFVSLGERTKTLQLAALGFARAGVALPGEVAQTIEDMRDAIVAQNLINMATAAKLARLFAENGIEALAFKGVLRSRSLYNHWGARPANDLDLLVARDDYEASRSLLENNGFRPGVDPRSKWWHRYLGESPFIPVSAGGPVIDLHHRVQQPGAPSPRHLEDFFIGRSGFRFGNFTIDTLSPIHATLVTVISYSKALRSREPWLGTAHELAMALHRFSDDEYKELVTVARHQGMQRLLRQAEDNAFALFGLDSSREQLSNSSAKSRSALMASAIGEADGRVERPHRTTLLWNWTDGLLRRPYCFARELIRYKASEFCSHRESGRLKALRAMSAK